MLAIGQASILVLLVAAAWAAVAGFLGGTNRSRGLAASAGRALVACGVLSLVAIVVLGWALVTDQFSVRYVAEYSSSTQGLVYKLAAIWGGQAGSLLVWLAMLAVFSALVVFRGRQIPHDMRGYTYGFLGLTTAFFALLTALISNPFVRLAPGEIPVDGIGLNPLLQNPWMIIHPPALLLGYVGTTVPCALALAALLAGRLDGTWVRLSRRWNLFAFTLLTAGIILGAYWAYIELGWGGYWAWDPVENASLMPWIVLAAFVHSAIVQERRGALKVWNVSLAMMAFLMSIFGTFLTRSGLISSVHAFGRSSIGYWFAVFMLVCFLIFLVAILRRLSGLGPESQLVSLISREGAVWAGNLLFAGTTLMVFLLTMYPAFTELRTGVQQTLEPIQFTEVTRPWFLVIVFLMGVGPVIAWRKMAPRSLAKIVLPHLALGALVAVVLFALGAREPWSLFFFGTAIFAASVHAWDFGRAVSTRRRHHQESLLQSAGRLVRFHRRRYGGYLVHLGVVLAVIGIAGSGPYRVEEAFESVPKGASFEVDGYKITYQGYDLVRTSTYDGAVAGIEVVRPGDSETREMLPERRIYRRTNQATTEVAVMPTLVPGAFSEARRTGEDVYVILASLDTRTGNASFQVIVEPFINWLWLGGIIMILGMHWAAWPTRDEVYLLAGDFAAVAQAARA